MHRRSRRLLSALAVVPIIALVPVASADARPRPTALETVPLPDESSPEGIAGGPGSTFFAGSRADGSIYRGDFRTGRGSILVPGTEAGVAVGLQYDPSTTLIWVAGGATGTVTAYNSRTGATVAQYDTPPGAQPRFLNDVDITRDGVFVTDSRNAELVVVRTPSRKALPDAVELLPLTGDWQQSATGNNANGIRALPGGDLIVVDQGSLLRVDPDTGVADLLEQTGGPALTAGDGLVRRGNTLYVVYGFSRDSVAVVRIGARARSYAVTGELLDDDLERPTTATLSNGALWAVNGKFTTQPTPTEFEVVRVALRPTSH